MRKIINSFLLYNTFVFNFFRIFEIYLSVFTKRVHDKEFYHLLKFINHNNSIKCIDIGSNYGQSIISLSSIFKKISITSFEPLIQCKTTLLNLKKILKFVCPYMDLDLNFVGLGSENKDEIFYTPVSNKGASFDQEGTFKREIFNNKDTIKRIPSNFNLEKNVIKIKILDDYNLKPDLIKIDVQGYEYEVILGSLETIKNSKPIIFIEINLESFDRVQNLLSKLDYKFLKYNENAIFFR